MWMSSNTLAKITMPASYWQNKWFCYQWNPYRNKAIWTEWVLYNLFPKISQHNVIILRIILPQWWHCLIIGHSYSSWSGLCWCSKIIWQIVRLYPMLTLCQWIWECRCLYFQNTQLYEVKRNFYLSFTSRVPRECSLVHATNCIQGVYLCHFQLLPQPTRVSTTNSICPKSLSGRVKTSLTSVWISNYHTTYPACNNLPIIKRLRMKFFQLKTRN